MSKPKVGDIIEAHCVRCKLNLDATVAALVGEEIVSVVCRTCDEKQRFRPARPDPLAPRMERRGGLRVVDVGPSRRSTRRTGRRPILQHGAFDGDALATVRKKRAQSPEEKARRELLRRWEAATADLDARYARPHRPGDVYDPGEAILHKRHGMGIIEERGADGTLTVLFRRGISELESAADEDED